MADEQDLSKRVGLTPGKMALIGVLAVVLLGVLYVQYGSGDGDYVAADDLSSSPPAARLRPGPSANRSATESTAPSALDSAREPGELLSDSFDPSKWQAEDVAAIVRYDPFALPPEFPQPRRATEGSTGASGASPAAKARILADEVAKMQTELDSLRQRGVSVIVKQHDQYVAMIGDRTVHVGDEINGFTVTAIEPNGVRVEKKVNQ